MSNYILNVLEAWGADAAEPLNAIAYKPASVETRAPDGNLIFGNGSGPIIPNYMPPAWHAITKAKLIIGILPSTYQQSLQCNFIYHYKYYELAAFIELTPASVKQWYHRAIKAFKKQWDSGLYSGVTNC